MTFVSTSASVKFEMFIIESFLIWILEVKIIEGFAFVVAVVVDELVVVEGNTGGDDIVVVDGFSIVVIGVELFKDCKFVLVTSCNWLGRDDVVRIETGIGLEVNTNEEAFP